MTHDQMEQVVEILAADVHMLRLCAAQLIADHMSSEPNVDNALRAFAAKVTRVLETNAPPRGDTFATRVHEMTGGRLDDLIRGRTGFDRATSTAAGRMNR